MFTLGFEKVAVSNDWAVKRFLGGIATRAGHARGSAGYTKIVNQGALAGKVVGRTSGPRVGPYIKRDINSAQRAKDRAGYAKSVIEQIRGILGEK